MAFCNGFLWPRLDTALQIFQLVEQALLPCKCWACSNHFHLVNWELTFRNPCCQTLVAGIWLPRQVLPLTSYSGSGSWDGHSEDTFSLLIITNRSYQYEKQKFRETVAWCSLIFCLAKECLLWKSIAQYHVWRLCLLEWAPSFIQELCTQIEMLHRKTI